MLIIKTDFNRNPEDGQYFIELTKNRGIDVVDCDRLGYWCDKAHLKRNILEILKHFNYEIFSNLLGEANET